MKPSAELGLREFPTPHALTLPRLLWATLWAFLGAWIWIALKRPWGRIGFLLFSILGAVIGCAIAYVLLMRRLRLFFPLPFCRHGKCQVFGRDYVWRLGTLFGYETKGTYCYKCACGDVYIRKGTRFMELLPDGTRRPYKRLVSFRQWADDSLD